MKSLPLQRWWEPHPQALALGSKPFSSGLQRAPCKQKVFLRQGEGGLLQSSSLDFRKDPGDLWQGWWWSQRDCKGLSQVVHAAGKWLWGVYLGEEAVLSYPTAELLRHCFLKMELLNHLSLFHCQETASTVALMAEPGGMTQWELLQPVASCSLWEDHLVYLPMLLDLSWRTDLVASCCWAKRDTSRVIMLLSPGMGGGGKCLQWTERWRCRTFGCIVYVSWVQSRTLLDSSSVPWTSQGKEAEETSLTGFQGMCQTISGLCGLYLHSANCFLSSRHRAQKDTLKNYF